MKFGQVILRKNFKRNRMEKLKVVWLCWFVNKKVHSRIHVRKPLWESVFLKLNHIKSNAEINEVARWNTNAINEFEKNDDVELHVISPYYDMMNSLEEFEINNIHYHIFNNQTSSLITQLRIRFYKHFFCKEPDYSCNRKLIRMLIKKITPDIIHVFGAENAFYSQAFLDIPDNIPTIIQLQTLLSDPEICKNYPNLKYRIPSETAILKKAKYIGTRVERFRNIIKDNINTSAVFLDTTLAVAETINRDNRETNYDFVYFAANIDKAVDLAIEAFSLAHKKYPNITLNVVGGYSDIFKSAIDQRIEELGIENNVKFEGRLPAYEDVIKQIRKARFALLPLKTDIISSTIREAMANGLPTITTITPGTPSLNKDMECVLLSEVGDHLSLANNMIKLLENPALAQKLSNNALILSSERESNSDITNEWVDSYRTVIENENARN